MVILLFTPPRKILYQSKKIHQLEVLETISSFFYNQVIWD